MAGKFVWSALAFGAALSGCAMQPAASGGDAYRESIFTSAVFDPAHIHPLVTMAPTEDPVEVVSWTGRATADKFYRMGENTVGVDVWVTKVPQLKTLCAPFPNDKAALTLRLQQLLGLPAAPDDRVFVVMKAHRADIIRPCPDPDPAKIACGGEFPAGISEAHKAWIAEQVLSRYRTDNGYPWTRLGYTWDWAPGSSTVGASEFVIRKGAKVEVLDKVETPAYCR